MRAPAARSGGPDSGAAAEDTVPRPEAVLNEAYALASIGYPSFRAKPNAKAPDTPHGKDDATDDPDQLAEMFPASRPGNLATPLAEGVYVADIDPPKEKDRRGSTLEERQAEVRERYEHLCGLCPGLRDGPLLVSRSGGLHAVFRWEGDQPLSCGPFYGPDGEKWGEIRGDGRTYILVAPSVVGGLPYTVIRPLVEPAALPDDTDELVAFLRAAPPVGESDGAPATILGDTREIKGDPARYAQGTLQGAHDRLASAEEGYLHHRLLSEARALGRWVATYHREGLPGLTEADAREALEAGCVANEHIPDREPKAMRTIRDGLRYGMARPYTVSTPPQERGQDDEKPGARVRPGDAGAQQDPATGEKPPETQYPPSRPHAAHGMTPKLARELASYKDTDLGNGERFVHLYGDRVRWCPTIGWLVWDGRRWAPDSADMVWRYAARTIRSLYTAAGMLEDDDRRQKLANHAAKSERGRGLALTLERAYRGQEVREIIVHADQLDADPDLLNVMNGTLHLPSGKLRPHDPTDLITKLAPVAYDPHAEAPIWRAFQERITGGDEDLIGYKRRAFGYTITGHTREQCIMIAHGTGANGKSTELEVSAEAVGDYATSAAFDTFANARDDKSRRNGLARLMGARFVRAVEGDVGTRLAEGTVKNITGGEAIVAERKGRDPFEYVPAYTLWLASNHKPQTRGTDHGLWRRLRLVPYTVTIPKGERDLELSDRLRAELPGILAWLVRGAREWYAQGLGTNSAVQHATDEYRAEMDALGDFLRDAVTTATDGYEGSSRIHAAYREWCSENGEKHMSTRAFSQAMQERGHEKRRTSSGVVWDRLRLTEAGDALADRMLDPDGGRFQ